MSLLISLAAQGPPGRSVTTFPDSPRTPPPRGGGDGRTGHGHGTAGRGCRAPPAAGAEGGGAVSLCRTVWRRRTGAALRMRASPPRLPTTLTITPSASTSMTGKPPPPHYPKFSPPPTHPHPFPPAPLRGPASSLPSIFLPVPRVAPPLPHRNVCVWGGVCVCPTPSGTRWGGGGGPLPPHTPPDGRGGGLSVSTGAVISFLGFFFPARSQAQELGHRWYVY